MRPPSDTSSVTYPTLIGGRRYSWLHVDSSEEQQKSVTTKRLEIFLDSVNKDSTGSVLAKFVEEFQSMHDDHDYLMLSVNSKVRMLFVDEKEDMEENTARFIDKSVKDIQRRLESISTTTEPLPEDLADDMENRFMEEVQAYQDSMRKRNSRVKKSFCQLDREAREEYKGMCENDKKMLLEHFEAIQAAQDSALSSYTADLREAASVQGVDIDPILAAVPVPVAVSVSSSAPSTSTTAATSSSLKRELYNEYDRSSSSGSKRRRLPDHRSSEN